MCMPLSKGGSLVTGDGVSTLPKVLLFSWSKGGGVGQVMLPPSWDLLVLFGNIYHISGITITLQY